jgi:hypothetical protein
VLAKAQKGLFFGKKIIFHQQVDEITSFDGT